MLSNPRQTSGSLTNQLIKLNGITHAKHCSAALAGCRQGWGRLGRQLCPCSAGLPLLGNWSEELEITFIPTNAKTRA